MAGVHGDEPCRVEALREILKLIDDKKIIIHRGTVHIIFAHLPAIARDLRHIEMNLNRAFRPDNLLSNLELASYERKRALELMPYLQKNNALLDIHSSSSKKSIPFIICEPHSFDLAGQLPFPIISHGWDEIEKGGTDYYVNRQGGKGLCIEGGYHYDPQASGRALNAAKIFLSLLLSTAPSYPAKQQWQRIIHANFIYVTKINFKLTQNFADFQPIKAGQLIGYDGDKEVRAQEDGVIIFAHNRTGPKKEAFILGLEQ
ncbi:MAG: hypothetical protein COV55_03430 [Candidatus Komeilibacteria bacterium CG11_big_fil_rev_8_21_14_0_20_36_20]|uniref:Succinylglutamate desuccinylase/Aspartoacylase catalytic domain-containing protein n=1 Tax=Candidatus Komeilibacteria bacterium CG11_big_fil_rev_8_21_14_0_20_36_20 TaxID=1974477 RepID=A0A2H0NCD5_9BACT|nr:MAG: hypothetical protein COV55_03430 [Candidatus Komeilibacteria bacterium CG11_big_fil_rev_8_21_14_0_20_36_20]PIR81885.1 MAG: hypothetical protein COU21_00875 [Candidatus Komeilibacteria bacterium CG10_big_fil_rev_8_21_14_0_10_36_65]PJC55386.1 MAG: hypothetical protein CO027_02565 [Candidatus Komeilibacteria bacterium CG_4_9_14_0_2_um_filter_36_13]